MGHTAWHWSLGPSDPRVLLGEATTGTDTLDPGGASVTNTETSFQLFPVEMGGGPLPAATLRGRLRITLLMPPTAGVSVTPASCPQTPVVVETDSPHPTRDPFSPEPLNTGIPSDPGDALTVEETPSSPSAAFPREETGSHERSGLAG